MATHEFQDIHPKGLRDYLQKQAARFAGNFKASRTECVIDAIHDMRVAVKRLRTVLRLVKHLQPQFRRKKAYRSIKDLYKAASDIRDFHVQHQLLANWLRNGSNGVDEFQSWMKRHESTACRQYLKTADRFKVDQVLDGLDRRLSDAVSSYSGDDVITGINTCFSTVFATLLDNGPANQLQQSSLHAIRMSAKEARYCLEIIRACTGDNDTVVRLDAALKRVHRALGLWHDYDVGLKTLNRFYDSHAQDGLWKRDDYRSLTAAYSTCLEDHLDTFATSWQHLRDLG